MQTTQQQLYFGSMNLDRNRDRRMVFYGRVSTQHEQQKDALSNQMQWYDNQLKYNKSKTTNYIDKVRVKNLDEDSIQLVKGNFPPLISEELWHECD